MNSTTLPAAAATPGVDPTYTTASGAGAPDAASSGSVSVLALAMPPSLPLAPKLSTEGPAAPKAEPSSAAPPSLAPALAPAPTPSPALSASLVAAPSPLAAAAPAPRPAAAAPGGPLHCVHAAVSAASAAHSAGSTKPHMILIAQPMASSGMAARPLDAPPPPTHRTITPPHAASPHGAPHTLPAHNGAAEAAAAAAYAAAYAAHSGAVYNGVPPPGSRYPEYSSVVAAPGAAEAAAAAAAASGRARPRPAAARKRKKPPPQQRKAMLLGGGGVAAAAPAEVAPPGGHAVPAALQAEAAEAAQRRRLAELSAALDDGPSALPPPPHARGRGRLPAAQPAAASGAPAPLSPGIFDSFLRESCGDATGGLGSPEGGGALGAPLFDNSPSQLFEPSYFDRGGAPSPKRGRGRGPGRARAHAAPPSFAGSDRGLPGAGEPSPASALMAMGLPAAGAEASGVRWKKGEQHLLDERFGEVPAACGVCGTTDTCKWRRGPAGTPLCNSCGLRAQKGAGRKAASRGAGAMPRRGQPAPWASAALAPFSSQFHPPLSEAPPGVERVLPDGHAAPPAPAATASGKRPRTLGVLPTRSVVPRGLAGPAPPLRGHVLAEFGGGWAGEEGSTDGSDGEGGGDGEGGSGGQRQRHRLHDAARLR